MYYRIASAADLINRADYRDCVTQSRYYTLKILAPAAAAGLCYKDKYYNFSAASIQAPRGMCYILMYYENNPGHPAPAGKLCYKLCCNTKRDLQQTGSGTLQI